MVRIYYYNFDVDNALPGREIVNPPQEQTFRAHNNACNVENFFRDVLEHNLEEEDIEICICSIMCVEDPHPNNRVYEVAYWDDLRKQAFFGQQLIQNKQLRSWAVAQDIVAHEFGHGLTNYTAKLVYKYESGALDESYADIFAILIVNYEQPNISQWNWKIGSGFGANGQAIRDLSSPGNHNNPEHMNDYRKLAYHDDHGGVHCNCGIHNKAAYNLITSLDEKNNYLFTAKSVAVLFYRALIQLGENSCFSDSRRAIEQVAKTLYRKDPLKEQKIRAITTAFESVGITS
ncbi:hypothetical protein RIVM261_065720 [Rivularia sp. IAM M-261]|nr:hypothetical protein CAL7716_052450 [Calothrix sp. PCC 7716]GJD21616.1 hypothetical protein RIVM261_065720 [Rivularia sp. IAM M-261]